MTPLGWQNRGPRSWIAALAVISAVALLLPLFLAVAGHIWNIMGGADARDTGAQASMARAAWLGCVVAALSAWLLLRSLRETRRAVEANRVQVRANLSVTVGLTGVQGGYDARLTIRNFGLTRATKVAFSIVQATERPPPQSDDLPLGANTGPIDAGDTRIVDVELPAFRDPAVEDFFQNAGSCWLKGKGSYCDIFGDEHRVEFLMEFIGGYRPDGDNRVMRNVVWQ